mmetsp:Transcript_14767/g.21782  ORF Transcript_14767/g.21782 Transcript_14767/m.21782 type:complete len:87 (-) Transcript_14767:951-1211(-)
MSSSPATTIAAYNTAWKLLHHMTRNASNVGVTKKRVPSKAAVDTIGERNPISKFHFRNKALIHYASYHPTIFAFYFRQETGRNRLS